MENKTFITADAERNIPVTEPERQYYFIEKAKEKLTKLKEEEKREFIYIMRSENNIYKPITFFQFFHNLRFLHHTSAQSDHHMRIRFFNPA